MLRRAATIVAVAVITSLGVGTSPPARADFHNACDGGVFADVNLVEAGGVITFSGRVNCNGADSLSITLLSLTPTVPPGAAVIGTPASCGPCNTISASGTAPTSPGIYDVRMNFSVTGNGRTFNRPRMARFTVIGAGIVRRG